MDGGRYDPGAVPAALGCGQAVSFGQHLHLAAEAASLSAADNSFIRLSMRPTGRRLLSQQYDPDSPNAAGDVLAICESDNAIADDVQAFQRAPIAWNKAYKGRNDMKALMFAGPGALQT
jgi:hypothetical protein